ncbi:hypothetical protein [Hymenobacter negativus]|uniref:DUF4394 domain-containing protein n=1 Tax=Hymenobacter negativus TaxID=2795026 RepID=A0ABS3Q9R0_9BACT|nr:hypothetical protein [Hymenobacter negativus]MBO2007758.1 hypothetical protein [Hymenobacter negativus]
MPNFFSLWSRALLLLALPFAAQSQNVGIGTTSPTQPLDVNGNVRVRALNGSSTRLVQADANGNLTPASALYPTDGAAAAPLASTTPGLNNPLVALSGTLAVVLNRGASSLSLYDLSNPNAPVLRGTLTDATNLANAQEVATNGTVAAVLCNTANGNGSDIGLTRLFTLSGGTPALVNTLVPPPGALSAVNGAMTILDNRLFAVYDKAGSPGVFNVYDITTPATATQLGSSLTAPFSYTPQAAAAAGSFVAVSSMYGGVSIMSVANPAAPVAVGNTGFPGYNGGYDVPVALTTSTLCSLTISSNTLNTYSLSPTGVPTLRSTFATATTPVSVALSGSLAYVACRVSGANVLQIIDVSGSTAVLRGTVPLDATANNVATTGTLTAVASGAAANTLQVFNSGRVLTVAPDGSISSIPAPSGTAFIQNQTATAQSGGFNVGGNGTVGGTLSVGTSGTAGKILTPGTGTRNMLAVAYGQIGGNPATLYSTSGNYTAVRTSTGVYTITFTAASGLSGVSTAGYTVLASCMGGPGFANCIGFGTGTITIGTYSPGGSQVDGYFSFAVFAP